MIKIIAVASLLLVSSLGAAAQTLEELAARVTTLEQQLARSQSRWAPYKFPDNGEPTPVPKHQDAHVLDRPLVIEDRRISNTIARTLLAARIGDDWRPGPNSAGPMYYGGRPKLWHSGGAFFSEQDDTIDIAGVMFSVDPATGLLRTIGNCTALKRIYSSTWEGNPPRFQARSQDVLFKKNCGIDFRISKNADAHPPITSLHLIEPPNLHSGGSGLILGFSDLDANGNQVTRPVKLGRINELPPGVFVLYVHPLQ